MSLADSFPSVTKNDWLALVNRGDSPARIHAARTDDGISIEPIYDRARAGECIWSRAPGAEWTPVHRLAGRYSDALAELEGQAETNTGAIELAFSGSRHPIKSHCDASDANGLLRFTQVFASNGIRIDAGDKTADIGAAIVGQFDDNRWNLTLSYDPTASHAIDGGLDRSLEVFAGEALAAFEPFGSRVTLLVADGRLWHAGGASEVQELAAVLATFVTNLRALLSAGLSLERAVERVGLILAADADQVLTIAKLRAMRLLHARLLEVVGLSPRRCRIHVETAWRMMSRRDPRTNLLRTTGAAFAAAVGGADSITVLPFDLSDGAIAHARRLARNIQLVLSMEAHVGATADPAAGSGAIESLTDALAAAAWEKFRQIEQAGGMMEALHDGAFLREIAVTRNRRLARVVAGEDILVGVNAFLDDVDVDRVEMAAAELPHAETDDRLVLVRLSEPFEAKPPSAAEDTGS